MKHVLLFLCLGSFSVLLIGCSNKKAATTRSNSGAEISIRESENSILAPLENSNSFDHCKTSLTQLDALEKSVLSRPVYSPEEIKQFAELLKLSEIEIREFGQSTFTGHDASYLEQSLLLKTAIRGLELSGKPPLDQARLIFDWVCRTVYINDRVSWPSSPGFTLEAGQGIPLARAYLIIAAWKQIGLTGVFIAPKNLKDSPAFLQEPGVEKTTVAPVRLCGVKIGKDVYLFDHTKGEPLFGKTRTTPLTWAELTANLELAKDIADVGQVSQWKIFLSAPLQSLTTRIKWLEAYDPGKLNVSLATDFNSIWSELKSDIGANWVDTWFPSNDFGGFSYLRIGVRYSTEDNKSRTSAPIFQEHRILLIPLESLPLTNLAGEPLARIRFEFSTPFLNLRYGPNSAVQHLIRGQFKEVTAQLTDIRSQADSARTRAEQDKQLQQDFARWSERLQSLSANTVRAEKSGDPGQAASARQSLELFLRDPRNQEIQRAWVLGYASKPLIAESTYLFALSVHERTLRSQERGALPDPDAWKTVTDWWERYADIAAQINSGAFKNRDLHAKKLREVAESMSKKK